MNKKWFTYAVLLLSIALFGVVLAGCGNNDSNQPSEPVDVESLEKVSLNFYLMGDPPNDLDEVTAAINEKLIQDLNTEVKFHFSTWSEWENKYNLMLASGEPMDSTYAANWIQYFSNTKKGAFIPLDDLLPQYAPDIYALIAEDKWDGTRVDGKIYGIPSSRSHFVQKGVFFREDLRAKYDLPPITDIDSLEQYLSTLQANEPDMNIPLTESDLLPTFFVPSTPYQFIDSQDHYGVTMGLLVADPKNPSELISILDLPEYKEMAHRIKGWADAGYVSRSILSFNGNIEDEFATGKAAALLNMHLPSASGLGQRLAIDEPAWQTEWFPWNEMNGLIQSQLPTQDMTAIPFNAKHPERALMVLNKFMTDKSYYDLTQYGILDVNYEVTPDGALDTSAIPDQHRFGMGSWAWTNEDLNYKNMAQWSEYDRHLDNLKAKEVVNPFAGFAIDLTPVQTQAAAISQVYDQYLLPLHTGLVTNVEEAYNTMMSRMQAAGFDKFKEEIQRQLNEFLESASN